MSKMSRGLLDSMDRFSLQSDARANDRTNDKTNNGTIGLGNSARGAAAGAR
jgi:hypothetical protein